MFSVEAIDALYDRGGSPDNAISHYEVVYMKELKEDKTVQLMESAVIALENIASVLTQISYHLGADLPVKAVMPVSDKISYPAPEIVVNTADAKSEPAETEPAKAEAVSAPEPAKEEPETVLESLTLEDLRQACITASQHNSNAKNVIRSILTEKYSVKNISGLDVKDYYAFWKEIQSL